MKATATANANIALTKYWGKRDSRLMLPQNGSISVALEGMRTTTTVDFGGYDEDILIINDEELQKEKEALVKHLDLVREMACISDRAKMVSKSNFPVAAGLASSASGLAALSVAASKAAGLDLPERELSILARRGSGSASRSIPEGFVEWHRGQEDDGSDSFAESIAPKSHWPDFRIIACIVTEAKKKVSSRAGMAQTVGNCPYYDGWLRTINDDIAAVKKGIAEKDFTLVGSTAEKNALKLHALMMTTTPSIIYWIPATFELMHSVMLWREDGLEAYFTIDGGPQVKVICLQKDEKEILDRLAGMSSVIRAISCPPGEGANLSSGHLF